MMEITLNIQVFKMLWCGISFLLHSDVSHTVNLRELLTVQRSQ